MTQTGKILPMELVEGTRYRFLTAVWKLLPEATRELNEEIYPEWCRLHAQVDRETQNRRRKGTSCSEPLGRRRKEIFDTILTRIGVWMRQYHLEKQWVMDIITNTMADWYNEGRTESFSLSVDDPIINYSEWGCPPFEIEWNPAVDGDEVGCRREIATAFEKYLDDHFKRVRKIAIERGIDLSSKSRSRESCPEERIEWVVRRAVQGWSYSRIATEYQDEPYWLKRYQARSGQATRTLSPSRVRRHVVEIATRIDLPLPAESE